MDTFFEKIYIINLSSRKDKWNHIVNEMKKLNITEYQRFDAIRPKTFDDIPYDYYKNIRKVLHRNKNYIIGAMGCKLSHYTIIKEAKEMNYNRILILEDDVFFEKNFHSTFNNILKQINENDLQWDMIYLGQNLKDYEKVKNISNLVKTKRAFCTHSYMINSSFYDVVLNNCLKSGIEIDNFYNSLFLNYNCFCIKPYLTNQKPGYSDIVSGYRNYITGRVN